MGKAKKKSSKKYLKAFKKYYASRLDKPVVLPFPGIASVSKQALDSEWEIRFELY
jgi:hypothetical protein